jgi:hypothetical protein
VAVFYDFPSPIAKLLYVLNVRVFILFVEVFRLLGVVLEEMFDEEKAIETFSYILQRYFQHLRSATLQKSPDAVESVCSSSLNSPSLYCCVLGAIS